MWKPITLRSHYKHMKHRHSPLVLHKPKARRASPAQAGGATASLHSVHSRSASSSSSTGGECGGGAHRQSPAAAATTTPFQFVGGGGGGVSGSADSVATPLESPVPRPASASSGFYDSSASQTSLNTSCGGGGGGGAFCFSPAPMAQPFAPPPQKTAFLKSRSLSNEEPVSWLCNTNQPLASHAATVSQLSLSSTQLETQLSTNQSSAMLRSLANQASSMCGSMPAINFGSSSCNAGGGGAASGYTSHPVSPRHQRRVPPPPRCRSQPCVLNERKQGGLKRRRSHRPAIDFAKMTEVGARAQCVSATRELGEDEGTCVSWAGRCVTL